MYTMIYQYFIMLLLLEGTEKDFIHLDSTPTFIATFESAYYE